MELLYLLTVRIENCVTRFNLIPSSNWPYSPNDGQYDDGSDNAALVQIKPPGNTLPKFPKAPGTEKPLYTFSASSESHKEISN